MKDLQRIEEILAQALELEEAAREGFVKDACGGDEELEREVLSLLASHGEAPEDFLAQSPAVLQDIRRIVPLSEGDRAGAYRLLEVIGEGGMGVVFLAERADGAFESRVAVKVLRHGLLDSHAVYRFNRERQILATLDHPGIARLYDGGATEKGYPFLVMEHVDGVSIDTYCDGKKLTIRQRLELFIEVCEAVGEAHRQLIVHRDLKPSNVLVTHDGRPKLLDFGISKLLGSSVEGEDLTGSWQRMMTPSYASPEQVSGGQITVATDVYLLGILLYKLLTGKPPFRFVKGSLIDIEKVLATEEPRTPSSVVRRQTASGPAEASLGSLSSVDKDLDSIVLKALRPEPKERYLSVAALIDDLDRYLGGFPVEARAGTWRYRASKFFRRRWRALVGLAALALLLAAFGVDRLHQMERRDQALARSEALWSFFEDLFHHADPEVSKGAEMTVLEILAKGEEQMIRGPFERGDLEASINALFGRIRYRLGDVEAADRSLQRSVRGFGALEQKDQAQTIDELRALGDLALVMIERGEGEDDARQAEELARDVYDRSLGLGEITPELRLELSNPLAEIYCRLERWEDAVPLTEEAMSIAAEVDSPYDLNIATALGRRALILKNHDGDLENARRLYTRALDIYLQIVGPIHPEVANLHNQLGIIAAELGELPAAIEAHNEALRVRRELYPGGHWSQRQSQLHLADALRARGDAKPAAVVLKQRVELCDQLYGPVDGRTVQAHLYLAEALIEAGSFSEAEAVLDGQLTAHMRAARPSSSRLIVQAEGLRGVVRWRQGHRDGEGAARQSLETLRAKPAGYEGAIRFLDEQLKKN